MARCGEAEHPVATYGRVMEHRTMVNPSMMEVAAMARIETRSADQSAKAQARSMWALGDYHRFAKENVWTLGPLLVQACGIGPGQRVLDVAAGTGNVAIRAAETGANVVASDLTPESLEAGRGEARARGVELDWIEADAEALPFADAEFDVVTSALGVIFAPNQQAVADELVRVCRPGGTIGMINFAPRGLAADFFELLARYAPPPPDAPSPLLWGDEEHVRELFGERLERLELSRGQYSEHSTDPEAYCAFFEETFGPLVGIRGSLTADPERLAALDHEFRELATRRNVGPPAGPAEFPYEYLLVVGRTATP
jgi:ubiquinone/menaquinone biosynthesis C-methylase UbiE